MNIEQGDLRGGGRRRRSTYFILAAAIAIGAAAVVALIGMRQEARLRVTCIGAIDGERVHRAVSGRDVILKAVVAAPRGANLEYEWDFGDGSKPVKQRVVDPYNLGIRHRYPDAGKSGVTYKAMVTVRDLHTGETKDDSYPVLFCAEDDNTRGKIMREDGLWALHTSMARRDDPGKICRGTWSGNSFPEAITAFGALAFQLNGYTSWQDRSKRPYAETVDRAITYVLGELKKAEIKPQPAGNPDSNGNGYGLYAHQEMPLYVTPIIALALIADRMPDRTASSDSETVDGRTMRDIVRDMVDFIAFAQTEDGDARGGWRYTPNKEADMSVTQWPVLAMISARQNLGIDAPAWVRKELLEHWLVYIQAKDGAFWYKDLSSTDSTAPVRTAGGLICFSFCGLNASDDKVRRAIDAIGRDWGNDNVGNLYTMYTITKAAKLTSPHVAKFGQHDWDSEYKDHLFKKQAADGTFGVYEHGSMASKDLATAWGVLILTPDVLIAATERSVLLWVLIAILLLVILMRVAVRERRKVSQLEEVQPLPIETVEEPEHKPEREIANPPDP